MNTETEGFRGWCIVELMGHVTLPGYVTEQEIGGTKMIRIDVPESDTTPAFTKFVGASSIYGITPVDEDTIKMMVATCNPKPFSSYELQSAFEKYHRTRLEQERPYIEQQIRRSLEAPAEYEDDDIPI